MRISFRYKIQAAVLAILTLVVSLYVVLASRTLTTEKIAGLYENALSHSELVATRLARSFSSNSVWIESILSSGLTPEQMAPSFQKVKNLEGIWLRTGTNISTAFKGDFPNGAPPLPSQALPPGLSIQPSNSEDHFWIAKKGLEANAPEVFSLWNKGALTADSLRYPNAVLAIVDPNVHTGMLIGSGGVDDILSEMINVPFSKVMQTQEVKLKKQEYILASTPIESTSSNILLAYSKDLALEPVRELTRRSVYFGLLVIALTTILSLWIGKALTDKLLLLTEDTEKIANGDFNVESNAQIGTLSDSVTKMARALKQWARCEFNICSVDFANRVFSKNWCNRKPRFHDGTSNGSRIRSYFKCRIHAACSEIKITFAVKC